MYLIRKDGLWLLGFKPSSIREFVDGKLTDVLTCIWGNDISAAKAYQHEVQAKVYADLFGGDVILVPLKHTEEESKDELGKTDR